MANKVIACSGVSKRFRRYGADRPRRFKDLLFGNWRALRATDILHALDDVSFELGEGRMLGVIGRNGAGKSTLMRLVGGVSAPDAGTIRVSGRVGALLEPGLGFHLDLTGRENAFVNGIISGLTRREVARRFDEIVAFAELEHFIDAPLRTYSSGMRMRLGFAIAAHSDPDLLLIDEVLAVGDTAFQRKCMDRIAQFKQQGGAVLLVSHNLHEVSELCDEAIWLEQGRMRTMGDAQSVVRDYTAAATTAATRSKAATRPKPTQRPPVGIDSVALRDARGNTVQTLGTGGSLHVEMRYSTERAAPPAIVQVRITREDGLTCWEGNTASAPLPNLAGSGCLSVLLPNVNLAEGHYQVHVFVFAKGWAHLYHAAPVQPLRIQGPRANPEGVVSLAARWDLHPASGGEPEEPPATPRLTAGGT